jgi:sulfate transport system permease protein
MRVSRRATLSLRTLALAYLAALLLVPLGLVFGRAFEHGLGEFYRSVTTPAAISAFWLSITIAAIAVPLNAVFGIGAALVLVRGRSPRFARRTLDALLDLPFAVSPVIVGLALVLVYGRGGWLGGWLIRHGVPVIYQPAGMVLATIFVSLPFVVREVAPVLIELGDEQEQAAATLGASRWQTFRRITLPAVRPALTYGVVLSTARALGEFGAVSVVSSKVAGQTLTLPLLVNSRFDAFDQHGAYAAAALLAALSLLVVAAMTLLAPARKEARR